MRPAHGNPLVRLDIFRIRPLAVANSTALLALFFFGSIYMQEINGLSPIESGAGFLPFTVSVMFGAGLAQRSLPAIRRQGRDDLRPRAGGERIRVDLAPVPGQLLPVARRSKLRRRGLRHRQPVAADDDGRHGAASTPIAKGSLRGWPIPRSRSEERSAWPPCQPSRASTPKRSSRILRTDSSPQLRRMLRSRASRWRSLPAARSWRSLLSPSSRGSGPTCGRGHHAIRGGRPYVARTRGDSQD